MARHPRDCAATRCAAPSTPGLPAAATRGSLSAAVDVDDWRSPKAFWNAAFDAALGERAGYLAFAIRSDTGCHPYLRRRFDELINHLRRDPRRGQLRFVTPGEAVAALQASTPTNTH